MITPRRIGHATFETTDLDRQIEYYTAVNGLFLAEHEKNRAFLATTTGQLAVELRRGDAPGCRRISFEVAPDADLGDLARNLAENGVQSEIRNDYVPGIGQVLSFSDPKGTKIELFNEWSYLGKHHQVLGAGPLKLGHIAFCVADVNQAADFYEKILGFRVSDWIEDFFVFMRCGVDHHTINFVTGKTVQMHHIAFELRDFSHIKEACELLGQLNIPIIWGPVRHGPGHNIAIYHRNPDDQIIEFFIEMDELKDEELGYFEPRPWHRDTPQRPKVWERATSTIWGPPPLPDFIRQRD